MQPILIKKPLIKGTKQFCFFFISALPLKQLNKISNPRPHKSNMPHSAIIDYANPLFLSPAMYFKLQILDGCKYVTHAT